MDDLDRRMAYPHKGDLFEWQDHAVIVTRVAKDGTWADIRVHHPFGATWTKRQPLPIPADWEFIGVQFGGK